MIFAYPWWFCALPILVVPWLRRKKGMRFSDISSMKQGQSIWTKLVFLSPLLLSLALLCLIIALARPQYIRAEQIMEKPGLDIVLVVDTSGSMKEKDYLLEGQRVSRMDVSKAVLAKFVASRPNDRIGLVVFGEEAFTQCPLTLDHQGMLPFLRQINIGLAGERATAIGDGLAIAGQRLKDLSAPSKVIILLTDGQSNTGSDPVRIADAIASLGIRIYSIGLGGGGEGFIGMLVGGHFAVDESMLRKISEGSGGGYYRAQSTRTLEKVYAEIDKLEPTTAEWKEFIQREEKFVGWVWAALLLLLLQRWLSETWLRRLP